MSIFQKKIKFVSATCPNCQGNLTLDAKMERATCAQCGAECIVENTPKQKNKQGKLELVLDFIERQQETRRQEKKEKQAKKEELEKEERKRDKKTIWVCVAVFGVGLLFCLLMALLEN